MTATLLSGASALPQTVWQACFLACRSPALQGPRPPGGGCAGAHDQAQARRWFHALVHAQARCRTWWRHFAHDRGAHLGQARTQTASARRGYLASNDPDFATKAADVIGLYLNPPQHAAVFSVDEKTAIQALDR